MAHTTDGSRSTRIANANIGGEVDKRIKRRRRWKPHENALLILVVCSRGAPWFPRSAKGGKCAYGR